MAKPFKVMTVRYLDAAGCQVAKCTPGARPVRVESSKWYGEYTDAQGKRHRVPLSTDHKAAKSILRELTREVELGKVGLTDPSGEHRSVPIETHVTAYEAHLRHKGVSDRHLAETLRRLRAVLSACKVRTLADLTAESVERYLSLLADEGANPNRKNAPRTKGASARTRNTYRTSAKAFSKWCHKTKRLREDVLANLDAVSGESRRQRRALTAEELSRLLASARQRPLIEAMTVRTGKRAGERCANVRPEVRADLEQLGRERALIYAVMVLTGLRRGEVAALEARHLHLAGSNPRLVLPGSATKNREEASLPLRADLAAGLAEWLKATGKAGSDRVFRVPVELVKILKRDLRIARIAYRDERGRTVDVHALRHTTGTFLSRAKVAPRIAQGFMRHSDIKLTMQTYTDPRLLDEAEALAALPMLSHPGTAEAPEGRDGEQATVSA